jgi:hypothetical protein
VAKNLPGRRKKKNNMRETHSLSLVSFFFFPLEDKGIGPLAANDQGLGAAAVAANAAARRQPWRARARAAARHPTCGERKSGKKFTRPQKKK